MNLHTDAMAITLGATFALLGGLFLAGADRGVARIWRVWLIGRVLRRAVRGAPEQPEDEP